MELIGAVSQTERSSRRYPAKAGILKYFMPGNLIRQDMRWIIRAARVEAANTSLQAVIAEAELGTCQIWRMSGEGCQGILVTRVLESKEVFIWLLAGKGFLKVADKIFLELEEFAKQNDCTNILCIAVPPMARVLARKFQFKTMALALKRSL